MNYKGYEIYYAIHWGDYSGEFWHEDRKIICEGCSFEELKQDFISKVEKVLDGIRLHTKEAEARDNASREVEARADAQFDSTVEPCPAG